MKSEPHAEDFPRSWYAASVRPPPAAAPLAGTLDCDVCVVGAGIAGCSAALYLAERGYKVVQLEEHRVGWGASGRSGAQAIFGVAASQERLDSLVGRDAARAIWDVSIDGLALLRDRIAQHSIDCDYVAGQMHVAIKPRQADELARWCGQLHDRYDYRSVRLVARAELREQLGTRRYIAGLHDSNSGHLHPLKYVLGLAAAAQGAGCRLFERTRALRFENGAQVSVSTPQGEVRCRQLLLAGNAWLGDTAPPLARKIMGVGTYIIATAVLGEQRARALIRDNVAVTDVTFILDYFRLSADHRLLFGGRVSYSGLDPAGTANSTQARMLQVFPQLAGVGIDYSWGGYVDITRNRAPHFGRLAPNVYFLQGFSGHGIALAGIAGQLVGEAIGGTSERFDVFARIPHRDFPGGALLRRPTLVLAMLYYRLRDLL